MSSVDNRIVKMVFDNAKFKRDAYDTQKSLADVDKAVSATGANKGLLNLDSNMQRISLSATKMATAVTASVATIASRATSAALDFGKNVLGSITQTILGAGKDRAIALEQAKFQFKGLGLNIEKTMKSALDAVKGTAFGLQDAATVAAQFGGAGIKAGKQMTAALTGISGIAAQTGKSYSEIGQIFTGIAGVGKLTSQDLIQFGTRGLNVAAALGKQMHLTEAQVRDMVSKGKISFKDFAAFANEAFGKNAKKSNETYTGSLANVKAALSRIGADIAAPRLQALKKIFNTLTPAVDAVHEALLPALDSLGKFELRVASSFSSFVKSLDVVKVITPIMQGFSNIFAPFVALFKAVGDAWRQVFPPSGKGSADTVYKIANGFEALTEPLAWLAKEIPHITPLLAALFGLFKTGIHGITAVGDAVKNLFGVISGGSLPTTGIAKFFSSFLNQINKLVSFGADAAKMFLGKFAEGFQNGSGDTVANILGAGFLATIVVLLRKMLQGAIRIDFTGGVLHNIATSFRSLTGALHAMQLQLQAKALKEIAIAIGLLTASVIALSFINADRLKKSLTAMSAGFAELLVSMGVLVKISGSAGFVRVPLIAASMVLLAGSLLVLVGAIALMSTLSWSEIAKGLAGVGGAMTLMAAGLKLMPPTLPLTGAGLLLVSVGLVAIAAAFNLFALLSWEDIAKGLASTAGALVAIAAGMQLMPATLPLTGAGLVLVGIALNGIGTALKIMGSMSWESIGKGLATLGGAMAILALGLSAMSGTLLGSAAMLVASVAINALVPALVIMSKLSWKGIAKSMVALAGGMVILGLAMYGMSAALPGAAALLVVAPAILALSTALLALSTLSWDELGRSLVALAGGLAVIGLAGLVLAPVIPALLGLGAALLLFGAGLALAGAGILAFSTAIGILVSLGAGAISYLSKYIGAFISLLPEIGKGLGLLIVQLSATITQNAPVFIAAFVAMLTSLIAAGRKVLPQLGPLISDALDTALGVIKRFIPHYVDAGVDIVTGILRGLASRVGKMADAAGDLIANFIKAIGKQALKIANAGADAVITLIHGMADSIRTKEPQLIAAMTDLGSAMVEGLIKGIEQQAGAALKKVGDFANSLKDKAKSVLKVFSPSRVFYDIGKFIVTGLTNGIQNNAAAAITAVASMVGGQISVANEYISKFIQKLDQQAIAARGKAEGLAAAAKKAEAAANKTKSKKDDKAADKLSDKANDADKAANKAEAKAQKAKDAQDNKDAFNKASLLEKAQMRSQDAQDDLDLSKKAETNAAKDLAEAAALDKQAKAKGVTAKQRKAFQKEADDLRKKAKEDAKSANKHLSDAKAAAADALKYQKLAGDEAAAAYQTEFEADAKSVADQKAFDKLSNADKAKARAQQAADLQKQANDDLAAAKKLAYTDIQAANDLAEKARSEADQARQYLDDAAGYNDAAVTDSGQPTDNSATTIVNLDPADAASMAMNEYSNLYDSATAAAAATKTVEFKQYNTSPEALSPTEIYRQTNNLFTYAVDKIDDAA